MFGVYGSSGFGREVMPIARAALLASGYSLPQTKERLVFIDDYMTEDQDPGVNGQRVLTFSEFMEIPANLRNVAVGISDSAVRQSIATKLFEHDVSEWTLRAENSVILDDVELGLGAIVCPFVTLTSNIRIGRQFQINLYSYVAHDCVIGDFVTFAPAVRCNGNVKIENHAYIGTGAVLRQGRSDSPLVIGEGSVVGMGAIVTKSVPAGVTVVGNPARAVESH